MTLPFLNCCPCTSGNFSIGSDSPVSEAWLINKSFESIIRISAGIISPAARYTISPGTSSVISISSSRSPARFARQVFFTIFIKESVASFAFHSCQKRRTALNKTIDDIMITPVHSCSPGSAISTSNNRDMMASPVRTPIKGLMNVLINRINGFFFCSWITSFLP